MSSLSLTRPIIIMVIGLPGAGKTFFARQFADTFNVPLVSYNLLYNAIYGKQKLDDDKYEAVKKTFMYQYGELLKTGTTIILDGYNHSLDDRQELVKMAHKFHYDNVVVWVQTDDATTRKRTLSSKKREEEQRYPLLTEEQYKVLADQLKPPKKEEYLVISGKHNFSTQARMVLRKISAARANQAEAAFRGALRQSRGVSASAKINGVSS